MNYLFVGGSFDPIHYGHLISARTCAEQIGADKVILVPSAMKAHKRGKTPFHHRLKMCQLAVSGDTSFGVSDVEQAVLESKGDSYTYAVIAEILRRLNEHGTGNNVARVNWMIGADTIPKAARWRFPEQLRATTSFVIAQRTGYAVEPQPLRDAGYVYSICDTGAIDISSTQIRERVVAGKNIRYLTPDDVDDYIFSNRLYASK
jgi:nicotinate-nucleotide adenylyltransferase